MNRKEGIIIGLVLLGTFVGGVFASTPVQQILNVQVTNFPENQLVTVLDETQTINLQANYSAYFTAYDIDISHAEEVTIYWTVEIVDSSMEFCSDLCLGFVDVRFGRIGLTSEFDSFNAGGGTASSHKAWAYAVYPVNHPTLTIARIGVQCLPVAGCSGTLRGTIQVFLQT